MINFFMGDYEEDKITFSIPRLEKVNFIIGLELEKLKNYYMATEKKVDRPNLLVNIINNAEIGHNVNDLEARLYIDTNGIYIGKLLGVTSEVSKGELHKNNIVENTKEIFLNADFKKINEIDEYNYLDFVPIRNIYSTNDSIALNHPTKFKNNDIEKDLFIYEIDIPLLCLQYRYWEKDRLSNDLSTDIAIFIYTVVCVKLMDSILSISLFNRFLNMFENGEVEKYDSKLNPINVMDLYSRIDNEYKTLIKNFKRKNNLLLSSFLRDIPLPYATSLDALTLTKNYINAQNEYVFFLSRSRYVLSLLNILPKTIWHRNKTFITDTLLEIKYFLRNNNLNKIKDMEIKDELSNTLNEIKTKIKGF